jgi:radical SAM protein with 4Fe4S-binding SPASM domain
LVYSGRGLDNLKIDIDKKQRRDYVEYIIDKAFEYYNNNNNIDLVTGNMEMDAILLLQRFQKEYPEFAKPLEEKLIKWGGNSAGNGLGNMDWVGNVKPDPFFPQTIGNYLKTPFEDIWQNNPHPILQKLRQTPRVIGGKCGSCKYINICNGGSRSRANAIYGDLWAEDPSCYLSEDEI